MKRITSLLVCFAMFGLSVLAQDVQISGKVTSADDGSALPGVSVVVKGTTVGTTTSIDGEYSLSVPANATLVFSFVGMKNVEIAVGNQTTISTTMEMDVTGLEEVVVTALGQTKMQRTIGYSSSTVKSDEFEKQSQTDAMNALQGKVAGVQVSTAGGTPGSSTRVIIRGYSSIKGNNNPLYVIDGTPINNETRTEIGSGIDFGNRANDISPNDIESMTILKGAAASTAYGPRAANGVILITTKKGKASDKISVEFSSSASLSDIVRLPQMQNTFGQGWSGTWIDDENGSWGPILNGEMRPWGNIVNNAQKIKSFSPVEKNLYDFYDYGTSLSNAISLQGGNERSTFRLSFNNTTADGIIPTEVDKNKRNTVSFSGSHSGKILTASTSFNYVRRDGSGTPDGFGGRNAAANLYSELLQIPRDFSIVEFEDYKNDPYNTLDEYFTPYAFNPYYALNENQTEFWENRTYGNVTLDAKLADWITATYRIGVDVSDFNRKDWEAIMTFTPGSTQDSKNVTENPGYTLEQNRTTRELNQEFLLKLNKSFGDLDVDGILGYTTYQYDFRRLEGAVNTLVIPNFYNLSNTDGSKETETFYQQKRNYGYYAQANLGYKDFIYLTLNGRQDYSSTLPKGENSIFYPSVHASFILSELAQINGFDLIKLRAGYGKAGKDADPYLLDPVFRSADLWIPFSRQTFPINNTGAFSYDNTIGNPNLKPEITTETEVGIDLRALDHRLTLDLAYYNRVSDGQILTVDLPGSTGFNSQIINFGNLTNSGIELAATIVPVKQTNLVWDITFIYTKNKSKVGDLPGDAGELILDGAYDVEFVAIEGKPLGVLRAPDFLRDDEGHVVVSAATGIPEGTVEKTEIGDIQPKYNLGVINTFNFLKDFTLTFAIDYRPGGYFYSGTADLHYFVGNATQTTFNERQPFIVPNSVKPNPYYDPEDAASTEPEYIENDVPINMTNINAYYYHSSNTVANRSRVIKRDYLKLREVSFIYKVPKSIMEKTPIEGLDIILSARNLFMWTPEDNNFVDPESTSYGNNLRSEFGEFRTGPTVRSFTASLRVKF